ncbi:hypothetical protein IWC96_04185 [Brevundimonas sp. BAL450]|jgi:hypothetical protein|uniref:hypothetical protein n=1 Tax=Brevundimonas sp. BAL450 TaxID=1708162 RepID=UPI0018C90B51|nr:hypothetical protein [Brevundimonas sp. BAL450]MBG7614481.1 hypothetical protein [Brevundimonas sp. BAL450]
MEPGADILLRLSAQRALLGAVTPNLRSFSVEMNGGTVACQAVFEEAPAAEEIDLIQSAGAEIIADFVDATIDERFIVSADQATPKALIYLIYQRHEPQE